MGVSIHAASREQNSHSPSKNSQPRAWRPLPSVISEVNEIMISQPFFLPQKVASACPLTAPFPSECASEYAPTHRTTLKLRSENSAFLPAAPGYTRFPRRL